MGALRLQSQPDLHSKTHLNEKEREGRAGKEEKENEDILEGFLVP